MTLTYIYNDHRIPMSALEPMRDWLADCSFPDMTEEEFAALTNRDVIAVVERHYDGGIAAFLATLEPQSAENPMGYVNLERASHTPGPWHANCAADDKYNKDGVNVREPENGDVVANVYGGANARLIAAAPELLEALRALLEWGRDHLSPVHNPEAHELLVAARAAIAKAEGRADG